METKTCKVGELARYAGVSVRTLRYYDKIGLLSPANRSDAGYRLYGRSDIARLQQIRALQQLGLSLFQIRELLDSADVSPRRILELQTRRLKEKIRLQQELCGRLEAIEARLAGAEDVSATEFIETLELMTMIDKVESYYTPEQLEQLRERREALGPRGMRQAEQEWPRLIEQVKREMEQGTDPADERVKQLARRWQGLVESFTGGDPGIAASLRAMYENEPEMRTRTGFDPRIVAYIGRALAVDAVS